MVTELHPPARPAPQTSVAEGPVTLQVPGLQGLRDLGAPTQVLCLLNMVLAEELAEDEDYEEILQDIHQECCKYGGVRSLEIPRPAAGVEVAGCGKVRVKPCTLTLRIANPNT